MAASLGLTGKARVSGLYRRGIVVKKKKKKKKKNKKKKNQKSN